MLLLVPAHKIKEDDATSNNNNADNNIQHDASATSSSSSSTKRSTLNSGRVLVVLPSQTDLTSKLTVSDSSILTSNFFAASPFSFSRYSNDDTNYLESPQLLMGDESSNRRKSYQINPHGNHGSNGNYAGMVRSYGPEYDSMTTVLGGLDEQPLGHSSMQPYAPSIISLPFSTIAPSSASCSPQSFLGYSAQGDHNEGIPFAITISRRRHSHLGLALGHGPDSDTFARLQHHPRSATATSFSSPSSRSRSRSCPSRRRASAISSLMTSTSTCNKAILSNTVHGHASRSFREAFKKSMTVHSPLLTSTSSGMILDLSPGPKPNVFVAANYARGTAGNHVDPAVVEEMDEDNDVDMDSSPPSKKVVISQPQSQMFSIASRSPTSQPKESFSPSTSPSTSSPVSASVSITQAHKGLSEDEDEDEETSRLNNEYDHNIHHEPSEIIITAQDISAMIASVGPLTPLEIQQRLYAQQERQQKLRKRRFYQLHLLQQHHQQQQRQILKGIELNSQQKQSLLNGHSPSTSQQQPFQTPTTTTTAITTGVTYLPNQDQSYRGIVGRNYNGTVNTVDPFGQATATSTTANAAVFYHPHLQQQQRPTPHPAQAHFQTQAQAQALLHAPCPTNFYSLSQQQYKQQQQKSLPSCYYLPPSAFRTASAVAAEEQIEAERKRKEASETASTTTTMTMTTTTSTTLDTGFNEIDKVEDENESGDRDKKEEKEDKKEKEQEQEQEDEEERGVVRGEEREEAQEKIDDAMEEKKTTEDAEDQFLIFPSPILS